MRLQRYRLFQHHGTFYVENVETKKQEKLRTKNRPEVLVLLAAKNEATPFSLRSTFRLPAPNCVVKFMLLLFHDEPAPIL